MSAQCIKRLQKEIKELKESDDVLKNEIRIELNGDSLTNLVGYLKGPSDTPYADGEFKISLSVPENYPFVAPSVRFITKIWHPNISSSSGYICLDILGKNWTPSLTLKAVLLSLQSLLQSPEPFDPQDAVVSRQMKRSKKKFALTAKLWTWVYATNKTNEQVLLGTEIPAELSDFHSKVIQLAQERSVTTEEALTLLSCNNWKVEDKVPIRRSVRRRN